jgi:glycosyltransferase involved in cell wall biosynthesis
MRIDAGRVRIVGEAAADAFCVTADADGAARERRRAGVPDAARLVVYHGGFAPHKNLERLVRVFARMAVTPRFGDVHLVLSGATIEQQAVGERWAASCGEAAAGRIHICARLDDRSLAALINGATMAVLPSLEEGFGLTGIEAAACGAPLAATRNSAMPEALGDAAVYFDPLDEASLEASMARLLDDQALRERMRAAGLEAVRRLTWDRAATQLLAVFDEVEAELRGRP